MIIAVDATTLGSGLGGDETLVLGLLRGLAATLPASDRVRVLAAPGVELPDVVLDHSSFDVQRAVRHPGLRHFGLTLPRWLHGLARSAAQPDVVVSLTHAPLRSPVPVALVVTDLSFVHVPDAYPWRTRLRLRTLIGTQVRRVGTVLTISEFCRADLESTYSLPAEKVHVVPLAIDPPAPPEALARTSLAARGVRAPYLLYLGNLHPRKNVARAITAFSAVRRSDPRLAQHRFVVAGARWFGSQAETDAASADPGAVCFVDRVDDAEREVLLREAQALVYLSTFEGFGLPPLEAMARDTVVLAADRTAIPEVCGDAALLVDPTDLTQIEVGLQRVLTEPALQAELVARGRRRVAHYSVLETGRALLTALEGFRAPEEHPVSTSPVLDRAP